MSTLTKTRSGTQALEALMICHLGVEQLHSHLLNNPEFLVWFQSNDRNLKKFLLRAIPTAKEARTFYNNILKVGELANEKYLAGETDEIEYVDSENDEWYYKHTPEALRNEKLSMLINSIK